MQKTDFKWELIIADDYSTDGTREIIKEYKKKFPDSIKLILQKKNFGPEKNWLDLMASPKTKYVLYTEGDDYFIDTYKLQKQVDYLETHREFSMCFHPVKVVYEDASRPDGLFPPEDKLPKDGVIEFKDLLASNIIQTNSAMYRWRFNKKNIKSTFPRNITPGDWFLHLLHAQTGNVGYMDQVMSVYRRHPGALWWGSHNKGHDFWEKYGLAHIKMYLEQLKLAGDNQSNRSIVMPHIYEIFSEFSSANKKLLKSAATKHPDIAVDFMIDQSQKLETLFAAQNKISIQEEQITNQKSHINNLERELKAIKASRVWKLRNRIAKILRKQVIK